MSKAVIRITEVSYPPMGKGQFRHGYSGPKAEAFFPDGRPIPGTAFLGTEDDARKHCEQELTRLGIDFEAVEPP